MTRGSIQEYTEAVRGRYLGPGKKEKGRECGNKSERSGALVPPTVLEMMSSGQSSAQSAPESEQNEFLFNPCVGEIQFMRASSIPL